MLARICAVLMMSASFVSAQKDAAQRAEWNRSMKPVHILSNLYYVGAQGVSSFLITTPAGDILIDGGLFETAPIIERNISDLGFHIADVRILLNSHAHYDHCGGLTELKAKSGGTMIASEADSMASSHGRKLNCLDPDKRFVPVRVDRIVHEDEVVQLGDVKLTAHITPGHTRGCTTWSMPISEGGQVYQAVFYCSTSVAGNRLSGRPTYPNIVADYRSSFAKLQHMPCDIFLGPHGSFFDLQEKARAVRDGQKLAFVDPKVMQRFVKQSKEDFEAELSAQQKIRHGGYLNPSR